MPSFDGGNNTDRSYAPHMYVMSSSGDLDDDSNYEFVGNATARYVETDQDGNLVAVYRIGVTPENKIICDKSKDIFTHSDLETVPIYNIPAEAMNAAIKRGADQLPFEHGFRLLRAFGIECPNITDESVTGDGLDNDFTSEDPERVRKAKQNLTKWRKIGQLILRQRGLLEE